MTTIIDGNKTAAATKTQVAERVERLHNERGVTPGLAVVLVGDDPASHSYVAMKERDCAEVGITSFDHRLPADTSQEELNALIDELNADEAVHGILVQMPLPDHLDEEAVIERIEPTKDVDGFHPQNMGGLVRGQDTMRACTPLGVMRLLEDYDIALEGKRAVVLGRSTIVGKPQALLLLEKNATVTTAHSRTKDLAGLCREADILVVAIGQPKMVDETYVKEGAVIIDVGINRTDEGLVGDVDYDMVESLASAITPVPGGVGPMTRAMLMSNTVDACAKSVDYSFD
ncbi:MAG: bifunctional methylenetetrahydrofolate dehydrogenase/methenyltetrahydrofolate cyclohydrolase FolD [Coriobacteriia bacterium]|nr:bifunctional methylenetetrahydrofolate dehydrogenase/methenyltetrahydrofolate cyclohydrolase FolD [Coriobacteriia bacterium]